jgi:hypothetical protein
MVQPERASERSLRREKWCLEKGPPFLLRGMSVEVVFIKTKQLSSAPPDTGPPLLLLPAGTNDNAFISYSSIIYHILFTITTIYIYPHAHYSTT